MTVRYTLEQVFGWLGTILWCIQLIPQVWLNYKRKTTKGLATLLPIMWALSGACLGVFAIVENINIPIMILCQVLYYDKKWRWYSAVGAFAAYAVVTAGFECGMIFASRYVEHHRHSDGLTMLWGILSDIFLGAGFIPQFVEIWRAREVYGISYMFLFLDSLGAVFSIMSLAFKHEFDAIAFAGFAVVLLAEIVIFIVALVLNPRARRSREALRSEPGSRDVSRARSPHEKGNDVEAQRAEDEYKEKGSVLPPNDVGLPVRMSSEVERAERVA
ncbi:hypothetical protein JCM10450v2_001133 [Rhodotorula kratochvilovae]